MDRWTDEWMNGWMLCMDVFEPSQSIRNTETNQNLARDTILSNVVSLSNISNYEVVLRRFVLRKLLKLFLSFFNPFQPFYLVKPSIVYWSQIHAFINIIISKL